jgi:hypothetical protein
MYEKMYDMKKERTRNDITEPTAIQAQRTHVMDFQRHSTLTRFGSVGSVGPLPVGSADPSLLRFIASVLLVSVLLVSAGSPAVCALLDPAVAVELAGAAPDVAGWL